MQSVALPRFHAAGLDDHRSSLWRLHFISYSPAIAVGKNLMACYRTVNDFGAQALVSLAQAACRKRTVAHGKVGRCSVAQSIEPIPFAAGVMAPRHKRQTGRPEDRAEDCARPTRMAYAQVKTIFVKQPTNNSPRTPYRRGVSQAHSTESVDGRSRCSQFFSQAPLKAEGEMRFHLRAEVAMTRECD